MEGEGFKYICQAYAVEKLFLKSEMFRGYIGEHLDEV